MKTIPTIPNIPKPSKKEVDYYLNKVASKDYSENQESIKKIFVDLLPNNKNLDDIMIKVACINQFDSTNIKYINIVSNHVLKIKNIDERLSKGDLSLIDDIASVKIKNDKKIRYYSFATKFCHHHFNEKYSIYDSHVSKVLRHFNNNVYQFMDSKFSDNDLKDYIFFMNVINKFISHFKLDKYEKKEIDRYLWLLGKNEEYFPNNYQNKKQTSK
ncbi:MAG: hypothetical protein ACRC7B_00405 [Metamycoplasmataceae bacterium]